MAAQKTLSILIVVLVITCTLGRSTEETSTELDETDEQETSKEQLDPLNQLYEFANNFHEVYLIYVEEAQNISEAILKDATLLEHSNSVQIQEFKNNLTEFLEESKEYRELDNLNDIVDIFADATEFYMELPDEEITPDTAVIIETLKKYGSDKLEKKFDELRDAVVEKFKLQFEETKPFLKEEPAMLEWFEDFKTLTDDDDISDAFEEFMEFMEFY